MGLLAERRSDVDRNPSWPATSAMASEQNQVASSSTRPALRSAASKRAPDESRSVLFSGCVFILSLSAVSCSCHPTTTTTGISLHKVTTQMKI